MIFLFWLNFLIYWLFKGIFINEKAVRYLFPILAAIFWLFCFKSCSNFKSVLIVRIFLGFSLLDYILTILDLKNYSLDDFFSTFTLNNEMIKINYSILRLIPIIIVNIASFLKNKTLIGFFDKAQIEVNSNDNTKIKISI